MNQWYYDLSVYNPQNSKSVFSLSEAKKEYSKLRSIARKRLERLGASEFAGSSTYKNWQEGFETVSELKSETKLRKALYDVARYLNLKTGSVSGAREARKKFVDTMNEMGYDWINERNANEFGEFMREVKKHEDYKGRDSEQLVELFKTAKDKRIDTQSLAQHYEKWFDNEKKYQAQRRSNSTISFDEFIERVERKK